MTACATGDVVLFWDNDLLRRATVNYDNAGWLDVDIGRRRAITVDADDVLVVNPTPIQADALQMIALLAGRDAAMAAADDVAFRAVAYAEALEREFDDLFEV